MNPQRRSKPRIKKDKYIELNRSIALFLIISKFLAFWCIVVLLVSSDDYMPDLLMMDHQEMKKLSKIPGVLRSMFVIGPLQLCLSSLGGLYAYATLHRFMLFYYAMSLVIFVSMLLAVGFGREKYAAHVRDGIYLNYKNHRRQERLLNILQKAKRCCGSNIYNFDDMAFLPPSCCPNITDGESCDRSKAYKKVCEDSTVRTQREIKTTTAVVYMNILMPSAAAFFFVEACWTFHLLYYLNVQQKKMILSGRKSSLLVECKKRG